MNLAALLAAAPVIQMHVAAAFVALASGTAVMMLRKGTVWHRAIGWVFVLGMGVTAATSLFITRNGHFSAIHLLTLMTIVSLPYGIVMRRRGNIVAHRSAMVSLFVGLVIAGRSPCCPAA